ncbi:peptidoglycan-binding protein [Naumannella huperziae]
MSRRVPALMATAAIGALLFGACAAPADEARQTAVVAPAPTTSAPETPSASPTPDNTPSPTPTKDPALFSRGAKGDKVKDLQARLKQIGWLEGKVTGEYDETTENAVKGFQAKRELEQTGEVDAKTLEALNSMTRKPTDDELNNRITPGPTLLESGDSGDKVKDLQARLKQLEWFSGDVTGNYGSQTAAAVKGFQEKRALPQTGKVDQRTLDRLHDMTRKPTSDELNNVKPKTDEKKDKSDKSGTSGSDSSAKAKGLDPRCMTGRVMCVSKKSNRLWWVIDGRAVISFDVRFGTDETPTREGTFYVDRKSKNHVSNMYFTPMPYAMFFSRGQAVHYSADFAARGYNGGSHGCVNVRDKGKIAKLYSQVRIGDKVVVYG